MSPAEMTASAAVLQFVATAVVAAATIYYAKQANRQADLTERSLRISRRREAEEEIERLRSLIRYLEGSRMTISELKNIDRQDLRQAVKDAEDRAEFPPPVPPMPIAQDNIYAAQALARRIGGEAGKEAHKACQASQDVNWLYITCSLVVQSEEDSDRMDRELERLNRQVRDAFAAVQKAIDAATDALERPPT